MEERQITNEGEKYIMGEPFMVLATQNPIEQEGTYRLPEAQLDRFLFKIEVGYPDLEEEILILKGAHQRKNRLDFAEIRAIVSTDALKRYREQVANLHVEDKLMEYIAKIVHQTRNHPDLYLGASPRASIAILSTSKAYAAMQGRDFVTPEDIQFVAIPVMRHRVILSPEKEMEGVGASEVINEIIHAVDVPR